MSSHNSDDGDEESDAPTAEGGESSPRDRIEQEADRAVEQFDQGVVDLLSWILDTETRARIFVYLRQHPASTSEEIAEGTGLYPSTVREALAELHDEEKVKRHKRESEGAGNNPYEYTAIAPSELVGGVAGQVQSELNTVFNLDQYIGRESSTLGDADEPVTITVDDADSAAADEESDADDIADADGDGDADDDA
ncbi:Winged helix-turn-helix DNA-binding [Natronoarchaeum philippinense]|uniref:Winged helix-turn-helix DNA-binding n=1 Tax=Natronoarchaeum philippinense TaxID=558529 RepID=A0A285N012_NATPI|nr:winged helix-turn-helix domain-containing protein [Natronoarchaeum philippinense]SNZ02772.1 Winged helix-turn-helix DNA-binding [Natronoarchaeum philippinense]